MFGAQKNNQRLETKVRWSKDSNGNTVVKQVQRPATGSAINKLANTRTMTSGNAMKTQGSLFHK